MPLPRLPRIGDYLAHYADERPDAPFLLHDEVRLTYGEARELVDGLARALLAVGVKRGDRVAAYGHARPEYFVSFLAAASIGAVWLGLNPKYTLDELAHNVADAEPKLLLGLLDDPGQDEVLVALRQRVPALERLVSRAPSDVAPSLAELIAKGDAVPAERLEQARATVGPEDPAALVYTSGSTGRPKGALLPHRGLISCCVVQSERWVDFAPLRTLCDLPINHVGCLGDICCSTLVAGGALFFMEKFDAAGLLGVIERERISFWGAVPTMLLLATRTPEWQTADLSSLRRIMWSGARGSDELVRELGRVGVPLSTSYGMTESVGSVTYTSDDDPAELLASTIGRPDPHFGVRIVRPDGSDCGAGEEGELIISGDCLMLGYLNRPEATAETIRDGWLFTGDAAVARADGNLELVGRLSDMYKSGGYNVYCREVEMALEAHPAIGIAAVVGLPDALFGEIGCAFVVTDGATPLDAEAVRAFLREHLANFKLPKRIVAVEELPRLPIGKVDKRRLRELAAETVGQPAERSAS